MLLDMLPDEAVTQHVPSSAIAERPPHIDGAMEARLISRWPVENHPVDVSVQPDSLLILKKR
jgi:hypothetical protein